MKGLSAAVEMEDGQETDKDMKGICLNKNTLLVFRSPVEYYQLQQQPGPRGKTQTGVVSFICYYPSCQLAYRAAMKLLHPIFFIFTSTVVCQVVFHSWCMCLAAVGWLVCSSDPRGYAGRSFLPLARPTKTERSLREEPDRAYIPVRQARGFGSCLTTWNSLKKFFLKALVMETAMKTSATTVFDGLPESADCHSPSLNLQPCWGGMIMRPSSEKEGAR